MDAHWFIDPTYLDSIAADAYERSSAERAAVAAEFSPVTLASEPAWEALPESQRAPYRAGVVECAAALVEAWGGELPRPG